MSWNWTLEGTVPGWEPVRLKRGPYLLGILQGEGIGPEIIDVSLEVLKAVAAKMSISVDIRFGGKIGMEAYNETGRVLTPEVIEFCDSIFRQGGAVLCGPGSGRFVYELRARFELFCKISPIRPLSSMQDTGAIKPETKRGVDILLLRENTGGAYFGRWEISEKNGGKTASHHFAYRQEEAERILRVALHLARQRRRQLTMVLKSDGFPSISGLWIETAEELVKNSGVNLEILQVDNAAFQLIHAPQNFDVIVSSNLLGDILADCAGVLLGSRGLCFSGNFGSAGKAVYQTGHGAAYDLQGRNLANPVGQVLSLVMLLQTTFRLNEAAAAILAAVEKTLEEGWRTSDMANPGHRLVGTRELGRRIIEGIERPGSESPS